MAKAIKQEKQVELREVVTQDEAVVLTLTPEEAETLLNITGAIGGSLRNSRRKHTDAIGRALRLANVQTNFIWPGDFRESHAELYFRDITA